VAIAHDREPIVKYVAASAVCHTACFGVLQPDISDQFVCIDCLLRKVDVEKAVKIEEDGGLKSRGKRRTSPVVDRKQR
jgi:hypothetical protein